MMINLMGGYVSLELGDLKKIAFDHLECDRKKVWHKLTIINGFKICDNAPKIHTSMAQEFSFSFKTQSVKGKVGKAHQ